MKNFFRSAAVAAIAFSLGLLVAWGPLPVRAAAAPLQPALVDLAALTPDNLNPPGASTPNLRSKTLVVTDGATIAVQMGTVFKHYHAAANEIQVVIGGSGTEWLGDKQVALAPGTMLIIPMGTPHGGLVDGGNLKLLSIKTPPQDPTDTHPLP
jgi:hypothetical protein